MTKARSNAVANAAKGDLTVGNGTNLSGILAVGNNGDSLVADSSTATGLRWQGNYAAGKNAIINGDFGIWQRGTSYSNPSSGAFTADRFIYIYDGSGSTRTLSRQTFTPGTAPVAGYEGSFFWRNATTVAGTGGTFQVLAQLIEDVRTFAGQTATFSFWAKADASRTITANIVQSFGSGGSSEVFVGSPVITTITTSWVRYSGTIAMPSLSGKTIGTNSFVKIEIGMPLNTAMTIDTWGWQFEAASTASPFQTATGTIQGELAACQRYGYALNQFNPAAAVGTGFNYSATQGLIYATLPVPMRSVPTVTYTTPTGANVYNATGTQLTTTAMSGTNHSTSTLYIIFTVASGVVAGNGNVMLSGAGTSQILFASAEL